MITWGIGASTLDEEKEAKKSEKSRENAERNNISEDINHGENISQGAVKMRHCFIAKKKKKFDKRAGLKYRLYVTHQDISWYITLSHND